MDRVAQQPGGPALVAGEGGGVESERPLCDSDEGVDQDARDQSPLHGRDRRGVEAGA